MKNIQHGIKRKSNTVMNDTPSVVYQDTIASVPVEIGLQTSKIATGHQLYVYRSRKTERKYLTPGLPSRLYQK